MSCKEIRSRILILLCALILSFQSNVFASDPTIDSTSKGEHFNSLEGAVYGFIFPKIELTLGFQAPIIMGGAMHSELKKLYPNDFNQYAAFNDGIGFYFGDIIGFAYQESIGGNYFVPSDGPTGGRDKISVSYQYSEWLIGGRINLLHYFKRIKPELLLGYHHGFINTIYETADSTINKDIIGYSIPHGIGILGKGGTDNFSLDISSPRYRLIRTFVRIGYDIYSVNGYEKKLESGKAIHISVGVNLL